MKIKTRNNLDEIHLPEIDHSGILFFRLEGMHATCCEKWLVRNCEIYQGYLSGRKNIKELAKKYKITKMRVEQIIKNMERTNRRYREKIEKKKNYKLILTMIALNNILFIKNTRGAEVELRWF